MSEQDDHICKNSQSPRLEKLKELLIGRQNTKDKLTCGGCSLTFVTICALHAHMNQHAETGSYHFDNCTGIAFPKHDSVCAYTQYDLGDLVTDLKKNKIHCKVVTEPLNSQKHENMDNLKKNNHYLETNLTVIDTCSLNTTVGKRRSKRKIRPNQKYNSDIYIHELGTAAEKPDGSDVVYTRSNNNEQVNAPENEDKTYSEIERPLVKLDLHAKEHQTGKHDTQTCDTKLCKRIDNTSIKRKETLVDDEEQDKHESIEDKTDSVITDYQRTDEQTATEALLEISVCDSKSVCQSKRTKYDNRGRKQISTTHIQHNSSPNSLKGIKSNGEQNCELKDCTNKLSGKNEHLRKCKICGKVGSSAMMSYHKHIHAGGYSCEKCGVQLKHPRTLATHLLQHEAKQFKCDQCGAGFRRKQYLETHLLKHSGERPFMCEECGQAYRSASNLARHVRHTHKNLRSHECDICHERFFRIDHMKNHRVRHFDASLQCKYCGRGFKVLPDLKRHMLIHTGEKNHICPLCPHGFISVFHYYKHMLKKHNIDRSKAKKMREQVKTSTGSGRGHAKGNRDTASDFIDAGFVTMVTESSNFGMDEIDTEELFIAVDEELDSVNSKFALTNNKSKNANRRNINRVDLEFQSNAHVHHQHGKKEHELEQTPFNGEYSETVGAGLLDLMGNGTSQTMIVGSDLNMINQYFDDGASSVMAPDCDYATEIVIDHSLVDQ